MKTIIKKKKRPLEVVFFCTLLLSLSLGGYNFWEWFAIEKLNQIQGYDFGIVGDRAYYYKSEVLYAFIHLFWCICFAVSIVLMLSSFVFKVKWFKVVTLVIGFLVLGVYIVHAIVA